MKELIQAKSVSSIGLIDWIQMDEDGKTETDVTDQSRERQRLGCGDTARNLVGWCCRVNGSLQSSCCSLADSNYSTVSAVIDSRDRKSVV